MTTEHLSSCSPQPVTFSDRARQWGGKILAPVVEALARLGLTPNGMTLIGFLLNIGVAILLAGGYFPWGGGLLLFAGLFDSLDGALARRLGRTTRFGALLDSTLDRYSEAVVFTGLTWFYLSTGRYLEVMLIAAALVGSLMVSYTRARAEGLGLQCKGGWLTRFERVLLTAGGLITGLVLPMLWIMAGLTNLTALQRILHVWRMTRNE